MITKKRLALLFSLLCLFGIAGICYQVGLLPQWMLQQKIAPGNMEPEAEPPNFLFVAPLDVRFSDDPDTGWRSKVQLFENGIPLGPSSAGHPQMRETGGGAFRHWEGTLCFTSSNGSDPRSNGFLYEVRFPYLFSHAVVLAFSFLTWLGALGLFGLGFLKAMSSSKRLFRATSKTEKLHTGAQIVIVVLVSLLWLWFVPPVFTSIDSVVLALYDLRYSTIPHYPILYPLFTRAILFNTTSLFHPELAKSGQWFEGNLTDEGFFLIGAAQMFLWTAAILAFVFSLKAKALARWLILGLFLFCIQMYFVVLSISSEALWVSLLLFQFTLAVRIFRNPSWKAGYIWYSLAVVLSMLTRHAGLFLAGLLPLAFLLQWIFQNNRLPSFKNLLYASFSIVSAALIAKICIILVLAGLQIPNFSIFGRAAMYHLEENILQEFPETQVSEIKRKLVGRADSDAEIEIIRQVFPVKNPWYEPYVQAHKIVSRYQKIPEGSAPEVDALLNRIMLNYFLMFHPVHQSTTWNALRTFLQESLKLNRVSYFLSLSPFYADLLKQPDIEHYFANLEYFGPTELLVAHRNLPQSIMILFGNIYRWGWMLSLFLVLTLILFIARRITPENIILNLSFLIAQFVYLLAISVLIGYLVRYPIANLLASVVCLGLLISQYQSKKSVEMRKDSFEPVENNHNES